MKFNLKTKELMISARVENEGTSSQFIVIERVSAFPVAKQHIESITLPENVIVDGYPVNIEEIGLHAFREIDCDKLILPNRVRVLHERALSLITAKEVIIPSSIVEIPEKCFHRSTIKKITFLSPQNIKSIRKGAFESVKGLQELTWPAGCKYIPRECFFGAYIKKLKGIKNVEDIGSMAFAATSELKSLSWPAKCKTVPESCFMNSYIQKINGLENVSVIGNGAFQGTLSLNSLSWPSQCQKIPERCFQESAIKGLSNTARVQEVEDLAFKNSLLESIDLPKVECIGCGALDTPELRKVSLGNDESIKLTIDAFAFPDNWNINVEKYQQVEVFANAEDDMPTMTGSFDTELIISPTP